MPLREPAVPVVCCRAAAATVRLPLPTPATAADGWQARNAEHRRRTTAVQQPGYAGRLPVAAVPVAAADWLILTGLQPAQPAVGLLLRSVVPAAAATVRPAQSVPDARGAGCCAWLPRLCGWRLPLPAFQLPVPDPAQVAVGRLTALPTAAVPAATRHAHAPVRQAVLPVAALQTEGDFPCGPLLPRVPATAGRQLPLHRVS